MSAEQPPPPQPESSRGGKWRRRILIGVAALIALAVVGSILGEEEPTASASPAPSAATSSLPEATSTASPTPTAAPPVTPAAVAPITITGRGTANSERFHLAGDYQVDWTATPDSAGGCFHGARIDSTEVSIFETLVSELLEGSAPQSGTTYLYGVAGADYFVDVNSGCAWSFTFTQI